MAWMPAYIYCPQSTVFTMISMDVRYKLLFSDDEDKDDIALTSPKKSFKKE
jgi:hypothetical protein